MVERNVIWTKTADIQFVGILEYWVKRNKSTIYSKKLVRLVAERTKEIAKSPLIFKSTDFNDIRVASLGNFSIFYKITDKSIIIYAFWDNRQNPKRLLDILRQK
ncbi:type II toxin-antitoxin system RelE/ParE family toxin [Flagellimonas sp. 389]|uniref:type II toxin-antitoxin system RelE/ParE family toxin n=1 Tax=Flagellimonas sp. 389 TaxID=2835862 RepID=UPI001BD503E5|nr:type II toxin-antitoxin system RelE/ParE family toxin [Flagellimonas sp. 389]MBS9461903.1 type II toxin-antitoxin system RelE/ParE family toxin [Flagellimonas sp. 389]